MPSRTGTDGNHHKPPATVESDALQHFSFVSINAGFFHNLSHSCLFFLLLALKRQIDFMLSLYPINHSRAVVLLKQALTVEFQIVQFHNLQSGSRPNFRADQSIEHNHSRIYGKDALG